MANNCDLDLLPGSARELADLVGLDALQRLVEWRGGAYFTVPQRLKTESELVAVVGREAAERLVAVYAGEQIDLPRCARATQAAVWAEIVRRRQAGEPEVAVARAYGYTVSGVRKILQRARADDDGRQGELGF